MFSKENLVFMSSNRARSAFILISGLLLLLTACGDTATPAPIMTTTNPALISITSSTNPATTVAATVTNAAITAVTPNTTLNISDNLAIKREDFTVDFGDFQSKAQLTYPANGTGPFPTVILIPGSSAADMDFTVTNIATKQILSHIFLDIADYLTQQGFAVVRYNKHYVNGPGEAYTNRQYYQKITLQQLLSDADKVYATAKVNPKVDLNRIVLYGWSEGSTVATQLVVNHPEIAGLVLQGPVPGKWQDTFAYQDYQVGIPFLQQMVDANNDGFITLDELLNAYKGNYGLVAKSLLNTLLDPTSSLSAPKFNTLVDKNKDGKLDITNEVKPYFDNFFASFDQIAPQIGEGIYTSSKQLPTILDSITRYNGAILILQGANDANVSPEASKKIDETLGQANAKDHKIIVYPGLGHSLGLASSVFTDNFAPIDQKPLQNLVTWLNQHLTGGK